MTLNQLHTRENVDFKEYGLMSPDDATRDFVLFKLHKLFNFSIKVSKNKFSWQTIIKCSIYVRGDS